MFKNDHIYKYFDCVAKTKYLYLGFEIKYVCRHIQSRRPSCCRYLREHDLRDRRLRAYGSRTTSTLPRRVPSIVAGGFASVVPVTRRGSIISARADRSVPKLFVKDLSNVRIAANYLLSSDVSMAFL
jgi:hypothetical protein